MGGLTNSLIMERNFQNVGSSKVPPPEGFREAYTLHLADDALILGHRNSEWCGHGPVLEQDIAITNIALDLIGQARNFYQYAAQLINRSQKSESTKVSPSGGDLEGASEDTLAYLRDRHDFKNCLLTEQPNGDWAKTVLRQFFFSVYQIFLYEELKKSADAQLAAIAEKSLKEVTYHLRWSSEWVIRLGDGTEESHQRMLIAIDELWPYSGELFEATSYERGAAKQGFGVSPSSLKPKWQDKVKQVFHEATLPYPGDVLMESGGKEGHHTEHLSNILADLQFMQRTYPNSEW
jgi:ring-1,2-phenylacetyl-CoA epoxidase subunit PaaC